jgi:hypothetical protein
VIPAGAGHQNLGSGTGFLVVGAYPRGERWNPCRDLANEWPQVLHDVARVPLPATDPMYGAEGPLVEHWLRRSQSLPRPPPVGRSSSARGTAIKKSVTVETATASATACTVASPAWPRG